MTRNTNRLISNSLNSSPSLHHQPPLQLPRRVEYQPQFPALSGPKLYREDADCHPDRIADVVSRYAA